jgi:hypothetical protein
MIKREIDYKVANGKLIRLDAFFDNSNSCIVEDIKITGDFFIHPENAIFEIEKRIIKNVKGKKIKEQDLIYLKNEIADFINKKKIKLVGFCVDDLINAIKGIFES